jgi:hypothetical protein
VVKKSQKTKSKVEMIMGEIKFQYNDIERVLKEMAMASTSLEPSLPKDVVKNNQLDVTKKMEQINWLLGEKIMKEKLLSLKKGMNHEGDY